MTVGAMVLGWLVAVERDSAAYRTGQAIGEILVVAVTIAIAVAIVRQVRDR